MYKCVCYIKPACGLCDTSQLVRLHDMLTSMNVCINAMLAYIMYFLRMRWSSLEYPFSY